MEDNDLIMKHIVYLIIFVEKKRIYERNEG